MEIVGGFMVMMSIISLFLAVVWLIMPFVVFAIKGKQDRTLEVLEAIEKRLAVLEAHLQPVEAEPNQTGPAGYGGTSAESANELSKVTSNVSLNEHPIENAVIPTDDSAERNDLKASPAV